MGSVDVREEELGKAPEGFGVLPVGIGVPRWIGDFTRWSQELDLVIGPLEALKDTMMRALTDEENSPAVTSGPRPEMVRASVKGVSATMPLLKAILHEAQNWPNGPSVRKPRERKEAKVPTGKK